MQIRKNKICPFVPYIHESGITLAIQVEPNKVLHYWPDGDIEITSNDFKKVTIYKKTGGFVDEN